MNKLSISLLEGLPVLYRSNSNEKGIALSESEIVLTDNVSGVEHIPVPADVQNELRFVGMKGLTDFVFNL